jgi:hypothetical protein
MRVNESLPVQLRKYLEDIKADKEGGLSSVTTQKWRMSALDLMNDVMEYLERLGRDVGSAPEGVLGPFRRALGKVATFSEAVTRGVQEPDEEELRDLARRLGAVKRELMTMGRDLMVNQPAATASEAHELVSEAGEAIKANQRTIKAALRGLGVASDISELAVCVCPRVCPREGLLWGTWRPLLGPRRVGPHRACPPGRPKWGQGVNWQILCEDSWGPRPTTADGLCSAGSMRNIPASGRNGGPTGIRIMGT